MIFIPDALLDRLLQEDIQGGDVTTRALGIGERNGEMHFIHRQGGCVSAIDTACRMLRRLGIEVQARVEDGALVGAGARLVSAQGRAKALHQGWKAVQNLLEWSCGVTDYQFRMLQILRRYVPNGQIACTRKAVPGTRLLAAQAVLAGGGLIHRAGTADTLLVFANHRRFLADDDWPGMVARLRMAAPEKAIVLEADTPAEARLALAAQPDVLQLDKFTPHDIAALLALARQIAPHCRISATGGITQHTVEAFARTGVPLLITSAPYYAPPADIQVQLLPLA